MTCFHPINCIYPAQPRSDGKRPLLFSVPKGSILDKDTPFVRDLMDYEIINGYQIKVPCGKCIGCRLDYSRMWSLRSMHEAKLYKNNCFVTLTFNDENLPDDRSVNKAFIQSWLKRFRYYYGDNIRYLLCGEYGEKRLRPHYHILFFNHDFEDKYVWSFRRNCVYYRSSKLEEIWPYGFSVIGEVTPESSAYVSRYVTKKVLGADKKRIYGDRDQEFQLVSRMPGLGFDYFKKYYKDWFSNKFCLLENSQGKKFKVPIPRYYCNKLSEYDPELYNLYKVDTFNYMFNNLFVENLDLTAERLKVREELKLMKFDKLVRIYEMDDFIHNI